MANFFSDTEDIVWQFERMDLDEIIVLREGDFSEREQYPWAPSSPEEARDSYRRTLELVGGLCADFIAPRAEEVDRVGPTLEDGRVTYAPGTREAIEALAQADLMGFTLPRRYDGLNMPATTYIIAIEMVARADAALMTIFGLQDIAETINDFAADDQKRRYLPRFSRGEVTGAMVLTEPDAGSDLQAVALKATETTETGKDPEGGNWRLDGVKRFITNGCGEVLLVLARSEPGSRDGRGLSLFLCERDETIRVRRLEDKLGIHGSPTCEMQFTNTPAELVGRRRRGLTTYVMSLMNGARIAIAAQALGIAEGAYREALAFAVERRQFGRAIIDMPPVTDILLNMKIAVETGRSLLYETGRICDLYQGMEKRLAQMDRKDPGYADMKKRMGALRKLANVLTPMSKYLLCEMGLRVTSDAIQVHGGSGYMRDYPVERYFRDARITNIYEGTSQLQVVAILAGLHGGALSARFEQFRQKEYAPEVADLAEMVRKANDAFNQAMAHVEEKKSRDYDSLVGKNLSDMACDIYCGYLLLDEAVEKEEKRLLAQRFIPQMLIRCEQNLKVVLADDEVLLGSGRALLDPDIPRE